MFEEKYCIFLGYKVLLYKEMCEINYSELSKRKEEWVMGYCGECQHWQHKPAVDGMKTSDVGVCDVSGVEAGNMRHGCIMYAQRRKLEESTRSPIENFKLTQASEKK